MYVGRDAFDGIVFSIPDMRFSIVTVGSDGGSASPA